MRKFLALCASSTETSLQSKKARRKIASPPQDKEQNSMEQPILREAPPLQENACRRRDIAIYLPDPAEQHLMRRIFESVGAQIKEPQGMGAFLELLRETPPSLLVLHAALRGEGARHLAREASLCDLPVLLVGTKPASGTLFHWAHQAIQRPFSPQQILLAAEEALRSKLLPPSLQIAPSEGASFTPPPLPHLHPRSMQLREQLLAALAPILSSHLQPSLPHLPLTSLRDLTQQTLREALDDDTLEKLGKIVRDAHHGLEILHGEIAAIPLPEIFQMLKMQRQTGVFIAEDDPKRIEIYFKDGQIAQAFGHGLGEVFRLGRFLIAQGRLNATDLDLFLRSRSPKSRVPVGEQLVQLGYLDKDDLLHACREQTSELIYELLRWTQGRFSFSVLSPDSPNLRRLVPLQLNIEHLIMEALRRLDEWAILEERLPAELVFTLTAKGQRGLRALANKADRDILAMVDGKRTLAHLVAESIHPPFHTTKTMLALLQAHYIQNLNVS
jgi:hypothetical protein